MAKSPCMLEHFSELCFVNRAHDLTGGGCDISFEAQTDDSATHTEDGRPILYVKEPEGDERHIALGKFMDAWSDVERVVGTLLSHVVGTPSENIAVLMNALGTRGQMDVLNVLGRIGLSEAETDALTALLERLKTNNTRRNHIVHGRWMLELRAYSHNGRLITRLEQFRIYDVSDPAMRRALRHVENRRERSKYMFSIRRILALSKELKQLSKDFSAFYRKRKGLPEGAQQYLVEIQSDPRA